MLSQARRWPEVLVYSQPDTKPETVMLLLVKASPINAGSASTEPGDPSLGPRRKLWVCSHLPELRSEIENTRPS